MSGMEPWEHEPDERVAKLPKYAQDYIRRLRRAVSERDSVIAEALGAEVDFGDREDAKTYLQVRNDRGYRELPADSRVIFPIAGGWCEVRANGDGELHVMANGQMSILPQVSNVIRIRGDERRENLRAKRR